MSVMARASRQLGLKFDQKVQYSKFLEVVNAVCRSAG
jgi:hypothetical protein